MGFVVDKVSEDSFYENLLLGVSKILEKCPCVSNLSLLRYSGVRQVDIRSWEHSNGVILPEDLRSFYSSTNGFLYSYEFSYDYTSTDDRKDIRLGKIEINPINDLIRVFGYETKNNAEVNLSPKKNSLTLSKESKVFELVKVNDSSKVVIVYTTVYSFPTVWFYDNNMNFSFLAEDFTTYFRMCIAHLGIPCWQYVFSKEDLPEWSREMFNLMAPGVLPEDRNLIECHKYSLDYTNKIDPSIFSSVSHSSSSSLNAERINNSSVKAVDKGKEKGKGKGTAKRGGTAKTKK